MSRHKLQRKKLAWIVTDNYGHTLVHVCANQSEVILWVQSELRCIFSFFFAFFLCANKWSYWINEIAKLFIVCLFDLEIEHTFRITLLCNVTENYEITERKVVANKVNAIEYKERKREEKKLYRVVSSIDLNDHAAVTNCSGCTMWQCVRTRLHWCARTHTSKQNTKWKQMNANGIRKSHIEV